MGEEKIFILIILKKEVVAMVAAALFLCFILGLALWVIRKIKTCELPDAEDIYDTEIAEARQETNRERKARQRTATQRRAELARLGHRLGVRPDGRKR